MVARARVRVCITGVTHSSTTARLVAASFFPRGIALLHEPAEIEMS
jgi:hypothetical protein